MTGLKHTLFIVVSWCSFLQASPYSFTGTCASQGTWTQQALSQAQQLRGFITQIKDDPNCSRLSTEVSTLIKNLEESKTAESKASHITTIPFEIQALRAFGAGDGNFRQQVLRSMMMKTLEAGRVTANKSADMGLLPAASFADPSLVSHSINFFEDRVVASANAGLDNLSTIASILPDSTQCIATPGAQSGVSGILLHTIINTAAAFAGSGLDVTGSKLSRFLAQWNDIARNQIFAESFKTLNQVEYQAALSCLIEISSENYCNTRDSMMIFKKNIEDYKAKKVQGNSFLLESKSQSDRLIQNPLLGYVILSQHLPIVTSWLQKIQIGIDPKLVTDAQFQSNVMGTVQTFYSGVKFAQATYSQKYNTLKSLSDIDSKRRSLVDLITSLTGAMINARGDVNFFTLGDDLSLTFELLGIETPDVVAGRSGVPQPPDLWLKANYQKNPIFSDPDKVAEEIGQRLSELIHRGERSAIDYYSKWFIIDKVALLNQSFLGPNYNVKESMIIIDQYLGDLELRINTLYPDKSILSEVMQTRAKLAKVLSLYYNYEDQAIRHKDGLITEDDMLAITKSATELITSVYEQFEVMLARSSLLANRLRDLVEYDYTQMLRLKIDFSPFHEELFYATGRMMFDRLIALGSGSDSLVQSDLSAALAYSKENLTALETFAKGDLVKLMAYTRLIARNKQPSARIVARDSIERVYKDNYNRLPDVETRDGETLPSEKQPSGLGYFLASKVPRASVGVFATLVNVFWDPFFDVRENSKYPMPLFENLGKKQIRSHLDDEFASAERLLAELCTKSLAFNDLRSFWYLCKDITLTSPYQVSDDPETKSTANSVDLHDYLSINFAKKAYEKLDNPNLNESLRICAYRDYHRRNFVLKQTLAMKLTLNASSGVNSTAPTSGEPQTKSTRYKSRYFNLPPGNSVPSANTNGK